MSAPQIAVVVFPPTRAMARVERFRRAHDAMHPRIAAHITLVFPAARPPAAPRRLARALAGVPRFRIVLRGAGTYPDGSVHLRVADGARALAALHRSLTAALGVATPHAAPAYRPHLTVARARDATRTRGRDGAAALGPVEFSARAVSLVQQGRSGRWREIGRYRLGSPGAGSRRRQSHEWHAREGPTR